LIKRKRKGKCPVGGWESILGIGEKQEQSLSLLLKKKGENFAERKNDAEHFRRKRRSLHQGKNELKPSRPGGT